MKLNKPIHFLLSNRAFTALGSAIGQGMATELFIIQCL